MLSEGLLGREAPVTVLLKEANESQPSEGKDFGASVGNQPPAHPV